MKRFLGAWLAAVVLVGPASPAKADDKDATPILDKAIEALGGEAKLAKAGTATWSSKSVITFNENENTMKVKTTVQGLDHHRSEIEGEFNGNEFKGITVIAGDKGWRKFGDDAQDLQGEFLAAEKQRAYLAAAHLTILPLKGKGFKVEVAPDEKVADKPASVLKATGPDGKGFTLAFDKETGLPVRQTATVTSFQGDEVSQESTFSDYKDFGGVKRATKVESKWDGKPFIKQTISDFKVIEKLDADTFAEPK